MYIHQAADADIIINIDKFDIKPFGDNSEHNERRTNFAWFCIYSILYLQDGSYYTSQVCK